MRENTLAARPVGASKTVGMPHRDMVFTNAATKDVLPVPA